MHLLRALLRPTLYRDIELESTDTLHTLAWGITRAFGFDFEHALSRQHAPAASFQPETAKLAMPGRSLSWRTRD
jgi:hypothetical protein